MGNRFYADYERYAIRGYAGGRDAGERTFVIVPAIPHETPQDRRDRLDAITAFMNANEGES